MIISKKITAIFAIFLLTFSTACVETVVVGSVATGVVVTRMKSVQDTRKDVEIAAKLATEFVRNGLKNPGSSVDIMVNEGRVLLTGDLTDQEKAKLAQELAWKISGVKEVIDEIQLSDATGIKLKDVTGTFSDYIITAEVELKLLFERKISSRNYKITTVNQTVYLLGVATDDEEINRVLTIISKMRGVAKVVNHVILSSDSRRNG